MASSRLSRLLLIFAAFAATAAAQAPIRVRGTIAAAQGEAISVRDAGGKDVDVRLSNKTEIVYAQPIAFGEIRSGDFLGVTSMKGADGKLTAYELRRFPKPINPGHRPFDGRDDQTMTNATVAAVVQSKSGRELTLTYDGGSQKIMVPENASVSALVPGTRAQLVPGAAVNLTAAPGADGRLTALRIQASPVKSR